MNQDLSKFKVISEKLISKKVFYSDPYENNKGFYSLCLIPLSIGKKYKIENCYLSKTRDESYFSKVEDIQIIDRSAQVDLTKYSADSSVQNLELNFNQTSDANETIDTLTNPRTIFAGDNVGSEVVWLLVDPQEPGPVSDIRTEREANEIGAFLTFNIETTGTVTKEKLEANITGTMSGSPNINFTGANSYIINNLIKATISKNPASTYLEVNIFSCSKDVLSNLINPTQPLEIIRENQSIIINTREELEELFIPDNIVDWYPRFLIEQNSDTSQKLFESMELIASFSTIDSNQSNVVLNYNPQKDFIGIIATAKPQRYSYNLGTTFDEILETIENDGNDTLEELVNKFQEKFTETKDQLLAKLNQIKSDLESDAVLVNTMKAVNIEGILNFNLKEIEYVN